MPYENVTERFGLAVKQSRKTLGVSQEELAGRAGLHRTYISDIERGARNVSLRNMDNLAKALEMPLYALFQPLGDSLDAFGAMKMAPEQFSPVDILLVESNPADVELTVEAFRKAKVKNRIRVAANGHEALDYLLGTGLCARDQLQFRPQLILLDLSLPKMSGVNVLREIKRNERIRSIPVIVLTGPQQTLEIAESLKAGSEAHLMKPLDFHRFCGAISQLSCHWALFRQTKFRAGGVA